MRAPVNPAPPAGGRVLEADGIRLAFGARPILPDIYLRV